MTRTVLKGPAVLLYGGSAANNTFYTESEIVVDVDFETEAIRNQVYGRVTDACMERAVRITTTPMGVWKGGSAAWAARVALLWPHLGAVLGSSIFAATAAAEKTLVVWTKVDGKKYTFHSAGVIKMPSMGLGAKRNLCGAVTWAGLAKLDGSNNLQNWSVDNSLYSVADAAFSDTNFNQTDELRTPYTGAWGAVDGFTSIHTRDGWQIDFDMTTEPDPSDDYGVINYSITDLDFKARCIPLDPTMTQALTSMKLQGSGAARGQLLSSIQSNAALVIGGAEVGYPMVTLYKAQLVPAKFQFGLTTYRNGEFVWKANRYFSAGVGGSLAEIGVTS